MKGQRYAIGWPVRIAPGAVGILGRVDAAGQVFSSIGPTVWVCWSNSVEPPAPEKIDERNLCCDGCGLPLRAFGAEDDAPFCRGATTGRGADCAGYVP